MKQTIKIKLFDKACMPKRIKGGDWFDLRAAEDIQVPVQTKLRIKVQAQEG